MYVMTTGTLACFLTKNNESKKSIIKHFFIVVSILICILLLFLINKFFCNLIDSARNDSHPVGALGVVIIEILFTLSLLSIIGFPFIISTIKKILQKKYSIYTFIVTIIFAPYPFILVWFILEYF